MNEIVLVYKQECTISRLRDSLVMEFFSESAVTCTSSLSIIDVGLQIIVKRVPLRDKIGEVVSSPELYEKINVSQAYLKGLLTFL